MLRHLALLFYTGSGRQTGERQMDPRTQKQIESRGPIGGTWAYITAEPENERYTIFDKIVTAFSRAAMFLILLGVGLTFYEVLMRYLLGSPTIWVNEAVLWVGSMIYLFAGAYTMQRRAHIRITAVYDIVSQKLRLIFDYVALFVLTVLRGSDADWRRRCRVGSLHQLGTLRHRLRSPNSSHDETACVDRDADRRRIGAE